MKTFHTHLHGFAKLALACLFTLLVAGNSYARDVFFQWNPNPEPLTGYKLYYKAGNSSSPPYQGTGLPEGNSPIDLGKVATYTLTGLSADTTYHFVLTAYNEEKESGYSKIVTLFPNPSPDIITMSFK